MRTQDSGDLEDRQRGRPAREGPDTGVPGPEPSQMPGRVGSTEVAARRPEKNLQYAFELQNAAMKPETRIFCR